MFFFFKIKWTDSTLILSTPIYLFYLYYMLQSFLSMYYKYRQSHIALANK